jgi:hypothetical protein
VKNHSLIFYIAILVQTVEVIVWGKERGEGLRMPGTGRRGATGCIEVWGMHEHRGAIGYGIAARLSCCLPCS